MVFEGLAKVAAGLAAPFYNRLWLRRGAIMWSVVFIATAFFAITFAVVSYSMREVRRRERRAVWPR